jgi:hypothetical protein
MAESETKKVWVVWKEGFESDIFWCIFDSEEKAVRFCKSNPKFFFEEKEVE